MVTARDRSVQRESVWRTESDNKQGKYLSNVAIGYGKTALLHMINIDPNIRYLESICNSTKEQQYIDRLKKFLSEGNRWIHVDGGNRADTIIDWYDNKVKLISAIYTLCEEDEYGKRKSVGNVQLRDSMNREELLHAGGDYVKLVEQLEQQSFTIETYSELNEEDRRDLFKNLNDNIDLSEDEIRNCEISKICNDGHEIESCVFMFQEEFARRIIGGKNTSNRGSLWITTSLDWEISLGRKISPSSFKPQPKIESRLVSLKRRDLLCSEEILELLNSKNLDPPNKRLIRAISIASFNQRRKKLRNSLKRQPSKLKLKHGYDPKNWEKTMKNAFSSMSEGFIDSRPEELSLQDWVEFSAQIEKSKNDL